MAYNPKLKLYYIQGSGDYGEHNRLVPAPQISITPELYYANNTVVGYTYNIDLNGYATSLDLRYANPDPGFSGTIRSIETIKNIFNGNDGTLLALENDPSEVFIFQISGINVKSLSFEQSDNNWVNYSKYSIQLEANNIQLSNCSGANNIVLCDSIPDNIIESPYLVDMKKYKIKEFNDSWSFELSDTIYNSYNLDSTDENFKFNNEHFNITYTIDAVGKHYFDSEHKLLPAWEQAKNFCQYRLYEQVNKLITTLMGITNSQDGCQELYTLETIFGVPSTNLYLFSNLNQLEYKIFNEKISCEPSESNGSFKLTYNAILKRVIESDFMDSNVIHTFNVVRDVQDDGKSKTITMTVDGNIQGLVEGGLIHTSGILYLPQSGQILIHRNLSAVENNKDKYSSALSTYNKIVVNNTLNENFAEKLGITYENLRVSGYTCVISGVPKSTNHTSSHNYTDGTITYRTSYDSNRACLTAGDGSYNNISISFQDEVETTQEFIIPGRAAGPIIQKVGITQPKRLTINIDGFQRFDPCCPLNLDFLLSDNCGGDKSFSGVPGSTISKMKLTEHRYNHGTDGSYSITRAYVYHDL